jgi:hypothetical protein
MERQNSFSCKVSEDFFSFWMVLIGTVITSVGARDLDKFVAFVGYFAWYVYSCSFHFMMFLPNVLMNLLIL